VTEKGQLQSFGGLRTNLIYNALYSESTDYDKFVERVKIEFAKGGIDFDKPDQNLITLD
jgi:hypothetical protein